MLCQLSYAELNVCVCVRGTPAIEAKGGAPRLLWAPPGIEPRTACTRSKNHTDVRPPATGRAEDRLFVLGEQARGPEGLRPDFLIRDEFSPAKPWRACAPSRSGRRRRHLQRGGKPGARSTGTGSRAGGQAAQGVGRLHSGRPPSCWARLRISGRCGARITLEASYRGRQISRPSLRCTGKIGRCCGCRRSAHQLHTAKFPCIGAGNGR